MTHFRQNRKSHIFILSTLVLSFSLIAWSVGASHAARNDNLHSAFSYISPQPGADSVSIYSAIAVRILDGEGIHNYEDIAFNLKGSQSGIITGEKVLADDQKTILFHPNNAYKSGESVYVRISLHERSYHYDFQASTPMQNVTNLATFDGTDLPRNNLASVLPDVAIPRYFTAPGDLPVFAVTRGEGSPAQGYIFLSYFDYVTVGRSKAYLLILDNNGEPVYYNRLPGIPITMDFKKQPNGQLTYYNPLQKHQRSYALDDSYELVGNYEAGNGYTADLHDLQVMENGNALVLIYDRRIMDMSEYGGSPAATVVGCIVQEIDPAKNVVFEWRSWDHIEITDTNQRLDSDEIRYIHCNSVERDHDGNLLLSNRNLDEITKISRESGDIIWRLGGKKSYFDFTNDIGFSVQHDARRLPNGNISVYDNGNFNNPQISRGVEYAVDVESETVTRIAEYRTIPDIWALAMGNMQKQGNGNVVIGWGRSSTPMFTEFTNDGKTVLEFSSLEGTGSYRVFRFPWHGFPKWPPFLAAQVDDDLVHLYFSWNGSTETASYLLYGGQDRDNLTYITKVLKNGFESSYSYKTPSNGLWYFQVIPIDKHGQSQLPSNLALVVVGGGSLFLPLVTSN